MIIIIGGVPCSGKTTLMKTIISDLGLYELYEPTLLFKSQKYKDILVVGQYPENETFGGTDRLSYSTINKFQEFINQEVKKHKHILIEGDRFFQAKNLEFLLDEHDAMVYTLKIQPEEEKRRHVKRNDTQSEKWLKGRHSQISHLFTNFDLMWRLQARDTTNGIKKVKDEIMELL